ncbi:MAG: CARDB domain-containing protein [Nitrososphaerota archaeon]
MVRHGALKLVIICCTVLITSFFLPASAIEGGQAEIVITDIWLDPEHPQAGDKVTVFGNVYNGGTYRTEYYAQVVTIGFLIDEELRKIAELGNVNPGASNNVKISSGPIWDAEWGGHNMTVIIDYHNTLPDQYDNPNNNIIKKTFQIEPVRSSQISIDILPSYVIANKDSLITVNGSLTESDSGTPLVNRNVILMMGDSRHPLITDKNGKFAITKAITFSEEKLLVTASFDGNFPYLPSNYTAYVFNLPPSKETAALVLKIKDPTDRYNFLSLPSEIAVFQDSYDNLYTKISTAKKGVLLDDNTTWLGLAGNHYYLEEIYVSGRFFFTTDWKQIPEKHVIQENIYIPETAQIRFHVTDATNNPLSNTIVKNWIYSAKTDETGFTEWLDMLPTKTKKEPYVAVGSTSDGRIIKSEPFFVTSGEKKIIEMETKEPEIIIPSWIRNNAMEWSEGSINDKGFASGIQYLIEQKIIVVTTSVGTESAQQIPQWIKNNAKWWSDGEISDRDFILALQYLIQRGIIHI